MPVNVESGRMIAGFTWIGVPERSPDFSAARYQRLLSSKIAQISSTLVGTVLQPASMTSGAASKPAARKNSSRPKRFLMSCHRAGPEMPAVGRHIVTVQGRRIRRECAAMARRNKPKSRLRRWLRWAGFAALGFVVASFLLVLPPRWFEPATRAFMLLGCRGRDRGAGGFGDRWEPGLGMVDGDV